MDVWHLKKKDDVEKKLNAWDLKLGEHFEKQKLREGQGGTEAIKNFIESYMLSDLNKPQRRKISTQVMQISADISECLSMLYATCTGEIYDI